MLKIVFVVKRFVFLDMIADLHIFIESDFEITQIIKIAIRHRSGYGGKKVYKRVKAKYYSVPITSI
ncbi:hypothetical protein QTP88_008876 [Uroleucon formosanum]